jgi:hypothetical protein
MAVIKHIADITTIKREEDAIDLGLPLQPSVPQQYVVESHTSVMIA